jgi:hypothetical protein
LKRDYETEENSETNENRAIVFKKIIYHFPFVILDLSLKKNWLERIFFNDKSKITNGK